MTKHQDRLVLALLLLSLPGCSADERRAAGPKDGSTDTATIDAGGGENSTFGTAHDGDTDLCRNLGSTNQGCVFWAVDLPNVSVAPLSVTPQNQQFAVVVANASADQPANVNVFLGGGTAPLVSQSVPVDGIVTFKLPSQNIEPATTSAQGMAYRIESDVPITAYQFNPLDNTTPVYSNDASLLFPGHVLSKNYTAITGPATLVPSDAFSASAKNTGGFVSVVATENQTTVTLYPTQTLYPGAYQNVLLSRGQVLTAIASGKRGAGNLSGTRVVADKPVAVFSGSVATSEPTNTDKCCADHVEHQMLPLEAWGTRYAVAPAAAAKGEGDHASVLRISAAFDGTQLSYSPAAPAGAPTTLGAYETAEVLTNKPFVVTSNDPKKPFSVTQFLLSNQYFVVIGSYPGDPAMIVLPAEDQFQEEYVFLVPEGYTFNYVTIVQPAGTDVMLDGATVSAKFSQLGNANGIDYQYAHVKLKAGHHRIVSSARVGITVVGYSTDVSYGYPGGSGVKGIADAPLPPII